MIKNIKLYGAPILQRPAYAVAPDEFNDDLEEFVLDMIETLKHHKALGLAAPQVGRSKQIFIITQDDGVQPLVFINPSITEHTMDLEIAEEGCLSVPGILCKVPRFTEITVMYQDIEGEHQTGVLTDLEARIFQHEYDHLRGKEMTAYLSPVQKSLIHGKLKKINKYRKFMDKYGQEDNTPIGVNSTDREEELPAVSEVPNSVVQSGEDSKVDNP